MSRQWILTEGVREALKARIGLTGVTNSGKTYTALLIAAGLLIAEKQFIKPMEIELSDVDFYDKKLLKSIMDNLDWSKVAVLDTERKRALWYANNGTFGKFNHINFDPPYSPLDYISAINYLESKGILIVIIDSLSHAWSGTGGLLETVAERTAQSKTKNAFNEGWGGKEGGTALQNQMVDVILSKDMHIIATFRQKPEYVQERDETTGKTRISLIGTKPIQRDDLEYEFDITLRLERDHSARIIKNTVEFIQADIISDGEQILKPLTPEFGYHLGKFLSEGEDPSIINEEIRLKTIAQLKDLAKKHKPLASLYKTIYPNKKADELSLTEAKEAMKQFQEVM